MNCQIKSELDSAWEWTDESCKTYFESLKTEDELAKGASGTNLITPDNLSDYWHT